MDSLQSQSSNPSPVVYVQHGTWAVDQEWRRDTKIQQDNMIVPHNKHLPEMDKWHHYNMDEKKRP